MPPDVGYMGKEGISSFDVLPAGKSDDTIALSPRTFLLLASLAGVFIAALYSAESFRRPNIS